jgi:hypothetical protein
MAFSIDIVTSLKSIVESANIEAKPNMFVDTDNSVMTYKEFLSKLEAGRYGYSVRRDANNHISLISIVPRSVNSDSPDKEPAVGDPAPLFQVVSVDGREFNLSNLHGCVVVIKFGSSQCRPCEEDWTIIREVPGSFQDKPVVFLYMQVDGERAVLPADSGYIAIGRQWQTSTDFGMKAFPVHVVIDAKGIIRWKAKGASQTIAPELTKAIALALAEMKNGG